jgi:hypothetical protein
MEREILARITALLSSGETLLGQRKHGGEYGPEHWVPYKLLSEAQSWIASVANLVRLVSLPGSFFFEELDRLTKHDDLKSGASWPVMQKLYGLLASIEQEAAHGLLRKLEYKIVATTFDDFLDHAEDFHKANKAPEAGVLAAVVLEDTIKKIAAKNNISFKGKSLEPLIDELTKADIFTAVKAKRVKAYAGVRNPALHAEWDKFDIRDAGELISGTRELIEHFL